MEIADELKKLNNIYMEALGVVYLLRRSEPADPDAEKKIEFLEKIIETCKSGVEMIQRKIQVQLWNDDWELEVLGK